MRSSGGRPFERGDRVWVRVEGRTAKLGTIARNQRPCKAAAAVRLDGHSPKSVEYYHEDYLELLGDFNDQATV